MNRKKIILFLNLNVSEAFDNVLHSQLLYNIRKKNIKQIVKINERFSEKQKHYIDHRKIHANETLNQREHIAKFFIFFNIIFILQYKFIENVWKC